MDRKHPRSRDNEADYPRFEEVPESLFGKKEFRSEPLFVTCCEDFPPFEETLKAMLRAASPLTNGKAIAIYW